MKSANLLHKQGFGDSQSNSTVLLVFSYLVVSLETSNKGLHVGDFVMKTDRIWMNCTAIGKSCITVKEKIRKLKT